MSKKEASFNEQLIAQSKLLLENADIHNETHTVKFDLSGDKAQEAFFPKGISPESLKLHTSFINNTTAAVSTALGEIATDQERFNECKAEKWDGILELGDSLTFTGLVQLRDMVGEETTYGQTATLVDHHYSSELTEYMTGWQSNLADKAAKLFE